MTKRNTQLDTGKCRTSLCLLMAYIMTSSVPDLIPGLYQNASHSELHSVTWIIRCHQGVNAILDSNPFNFAQFVLVLRDKENAGSNYIALGWSWFNMNFILTYVQQENVTFCCEFQTTVSHFSLIPSSSNAWMWQTSGGSPSKSSLVVVRISILWISSTATSLRRVIPVTKV